MWTLIMYHQARKERPVGILIIFATLATVAFIRFIATTERGSEIILVSQFNFSGDVKLNTTTTIALPLAAITLLKHAQKLVKRAGRLPTVQGLILSIAKTTSFPVTQYLSSYPGSFLLAEPLNWALASRSLIDTLTMTTSLIKCQYHNVRGKCRL